MKMEQLEYFGIPHYIINIWKGHYSDFLLPVQEKAVREYGLLQPDKYSLYPDTAHYQKKFRNLLIASPSSSGKTLAAEMAALQEIYCQKKVIYLVPLRILAEEKYQHFVKLYRSIGLDIKLSSRDHREQDQDIIQGNFNIAIIVYEKFYYFLLQYPQFINNVSLIIADEIQLINDTQRGPRLESNFNYLKNNYPAIKIVALSTFNEYLLQLTDWLEALLLFSTHRPVELRKGIVRKGTYKYVEYNSKIPGEENFFLPEEAQECDLASYLKATLHFLIKENESSLIFFPTRNEVRLWSRWLASQFCLNPARKAIEELHSSEDSTSQEELITLLQNGIGYHCADLSWQERHAIEEAIRMGELKVICATGTLAMGVNLPVDNVILTGQKISTEQGDGNNFLKCYKRILTPSEVENMGGRAGRLKSGNSDNSFGRIIFLAPTPVEFTTYQRLYFRKNGETSLAPSLNYFSTITDESDSMFYSGSGDIRVGGSTINDGIFRINNNGTGNCNGNPVAVQKDILTFLLYKIALDGQTLEDIYQILNTGKYERGRIFWSYHFSQKYNEEELWSCLKELEEFDLIKVTSKNDCHITELGQLVVSKGITFQTYTHFLKWIKESEKGEISELEILFLIATSNDGTIYFSDYPRKETKIAKDGKTKIKKWKQYLHLRILNLIFEKQEEGKSIFRSNLALDSFQENQGSYGTEVGRIGINNYLAIKNTLTMYDWIKGKELREMEEDYGILGGNLQKMGEGFSWLADALSSLAEKEGWKEVRADELAKIRELSVRLIHGIGSEGLTLAKLNIPGLTRGYIQRLIQEGYNNEQCLIELSDNQLRQILPELLIKRIRKHINSKPCCLDSDTNLNTNWELGKEKDKEIDEECSKATIILNPNRPDRIIFLDNEIAVNKIGFQLISLLAKNEGKVLSYDQIIDTLWPSDEDATYHRLWYHLARLRKEMQGVIRNNKDKNESKNKDNTLLADSGLKSKVFRVIPGIGLMLSPELQVKWTE